jgi:hypothetical protein
MMATSRPTAPRGVRRVAGLPGVGRISWHCGQMSTVAGYVRRQVGQCDDVADECVIQDPASLGELNAVRRFPLVGAPQDGAGSGAAVETVDAHLRNH